MEAYFSYHGQERVRIKFVDANKHSDESEELNKLITSAISRELKAKNKSKAKAMDDSNSEDDTKKFNFEKLKIRLDFILE